MQLAQFYKEHWFLFVFNKLNILLLSNKFYIFLAKTKYTLASILILIQCVTKHDEVCLGIDNIMNSDNILSQANSNNAKKLFGL